MKRPRPLGDGLTAGRNATGAPRIWRDGEVDVEFEFEFEFQIRVYFGAWDAQE
jgi:hypothetical protein